MRNRSRRKTKKDRSVRGLIAVGVTGLIMFAVVLIVQGRNNSETVEEPEVKVITMSETETKLESESELEGKTLITMLEETAKGENAKGETEGSETEERETEPVSLVLDSLSGIAAGTVLDTNQIDFDHLDRYFMQWSIEEGDSIYERINGKSYRKNNYVPLDSLCYLKIPHYNFDSQIQVGELVVSKEIAEDIKQIFLELFEKKYQIQSMYLIDKYWVGDPDETDWASIEENNTSAFCYREVTGGGNLSNHAYGKAVDINPQQNPYVSYSSGSPRWSHENANDYIKRDTGLAHVITHEDAAYQIFSKYGFQWGGDWNNPKDYQHFEKR